MLNRFRGTMDEWDPAFVDALAAHRTVVLFDNVGVARSSGTASPRLAGWADNALAFADALHFRQVDVFGFSFGGLVAQEFALRHPERVRRLIIAGSGAGYVENANLRPEAIAVATSRSMWTRISSTSSSATPRPARRLDASIWRGCVSDPTPSPPAPTWEYPRSPSSRR